MEIRKGVWSHSIGYPMEQVIGKQNKQPPERTNDSRAEMQSVHSREQQVTTEH